MSTTCVYSVFIVSDVNEDVVTDCLLLNLYSPLVIYCIALRTEQQYRDKEEASNKNKLCKLFQNKSSTTNYIYIHSTPYIYTENALPTSYIYTN